MFLSKISHTTIVCWCEIQVINFFSCCPVAQKCSRCLEDRSMAECALDALAHASNDAIHLVRNIPMPGVGESRAGRHTLCWVAIVSEWRGASSSKMAAFFLSKEHRNNIFCLIWFLVFYFGLMNKFLRFWTVVDFLLLFYGSGSYGGFHSQCPASAAKMGFPRSTPPPEHFHLCSSLLHFCHHCTGDHIFCG